MAGSQSETSDHQSALLKLPHAFSIRKGVGMISLELKDVYFKIPICLDSKQNLWFVMKRMIYQFRMLRFVLSTASQVFTRVFAKVSTWERYMTSSLSRWLASTFRIFISPDAATSSTFPVVQRPGDCHQLGEIELGKSLWGCQ